MDDPEAMMYADSHRPSVGDIVTVTVIDSPRFGLFVHLDGVEKAFIDILEISRDGSRTAWDDYPQPGSTIEAVVIGYEENGTCRLSLKNSRRDLKERWGEYKHNADTHEMLDGRIHWCKKGEILVDIGAPFSATLMNPTMDANDWDNEGKMVHCRIIGFDDMLLRILLEECH